MRVLLFVGIKRTTTRSAQGDLRDGGESDPGLDSDVVGNVADARSGPRRRLGRIAFGERIHGTPERDAIARDFDNYFSFVDFGAAHKRGLDLLFHLVGRHWRFYSNQVGDAGHAGEIGDRILRRGFLKAPIDETIQCDPALRYGDPN